MYGNTKINMKKILINILKYGSLIIAALICIIPITVVLFASFKSAQEYYSTGKLIPPESFVNFSNYITAFTRGGMVKGFFNTTVIMIVSLTVSVLSGAMVAYVVNRFKFKGKRLVLGLYMVAMLIPMVTTQVATFQIINGLGLFDTRLAAILLYLGADVMGIYIMLQFIESIPICIDESAMIDGASYFYIFFKLILPLLKPAIATVVIIRGINIYNDFYIPFLYMPSSDLQTLSTSLYKFMGPYGGEWNVICAGVILIMIPTIVIFLLLQKYIYNGFVNGAAK